MIPKPGEQFETDVRSCKNVVELSYNYLLMNEMMEGFVDEEKESKVLSVLQLVSRGLEEVVNNYQWRIKEVPKPSNKVESIKP